MTRVKRVRCPVCHRRTTRHDHIPTWNYTVDWPPRNTAAVNTRTVAIIRQAWTAP